METQKCGHPVRSVKTPGFWACVSCPATGPTVKYPGLQKPPPPLAWQLKAAAA